VSSAGAALFCGFRRNDLLNYILYLLFIFFAVTRLLIPPAIMQDIPKTPNEIVTSDDFDI
jgi:hypothetical protein